MKTDSDRKHHSRPRKLEIRNGNSASPSPNRARRETFAGSQYRDSSGNMADQANGIAKGAQDKVQSATSGVLGSIEGWGNWIVAKGQGMLDKIFPPEKRAAFLSKLQAFMLKNPKLSVSSVHVGLSSHALVLHFQAVANVALQTFLGMNLAITGVPLFLFILFSLTVFIFALVVGLLVGVLAAVAFTLFAVGLALMIVLPTVFFTTMGATFLFLWGLGGYYILKWANSEGDSKKSDDSGPTIGDRLNSLSGGRLSGFMSAARAEESKKNISGYNDENTPAQFNEKTATDTTSAATDNVKKATDATGGAQNAVGSTTGTVTGGLGGVTS